jgi:G3E family GTPase
VALAYDVIPITLVTGFLGSGKSTLLADLLEGEASRDCAVLVNEFGEVPLDHLLVGAIDAQTVLLANGCLCCAMRGELKDALATLFSRRARSELPPFSRVVIETSGLATPAPIAATLLGDPILRSHYVLAGTLSVVDAFNFAWQREQHPEWLAQVSAADRLLITKADLVDEARVEQLSTTLAELNPAASVDVRRASTNMDALRAALFEPGDVHNMIRRMGHAARVVASSGSLEPDTHRKALDASGIASFCLTFDEPVDWEVFTLWFTMLLNRHGDRILRVKGLLWLAGADRPAVIHAIQHLVHPILHPDNVAPISADQRISRLVFIASDLTAEAVQRSYYRFQRHLVKARH